MSCIGVDFGNESCLIGIVQKGGVDIILNESSNRKNPSMVSFQGNTRAMGEGALSIARSNFKNTAREMKRLIGRKWKDPELQADLKRLYYTVEEDKGQEGGLAVKVEYNDEIKSFTPEQVVAMILTKVMDVTKAANQGVAVADSVISVPGWFTDPMRCAMLNACNTAGINCIRLVNEGTATALAYGIYKSAKNLFDKEVPQHTMFLDVGHSGFSVTVVDFLQESLVVKSCAYDRHLGGRDFDWYLAHHMAEEFKAKHGTDITDSPKSMLKLLDAAERCKKNLSPIGVTDAVVNVECLHEETDFHTRVSLEQFEKIIMPLVDRLEAPIMQALKEAGLTKEQLTAVEIVGGSTRVPLVKRKFAEILGTDVNAINMGLSTTMNADESVAKGAALQCAMLSKRFRVKSFNVIDAVHYPIKLSWDEDKEVAKAAAAAGATVETETGDDKDTDTSMGGEGEGAESTSKPDANEILMFPRNMETPKTRRVTLVRKQPFIVSVSYDDSAKDVLPPDTHMNFANFMILDIPSTEPVKVRLNLKHDINGIISMESAQMMEPIVEDLPAKEEPKEAAAAADAKEGAKEGENDGVEKMDVDSDEKPAEEAKTAESKEEAKTEPAAAPKKTFRKVTLKVETVNGLWPKERLIMAQDEEAKMAYQDRIVQETADKRNELESYIYAVRDRVADELKPYASLDEVADITSALESVEDWLYSDDGYNGTKAIYQEKLNWLHTKAKKLEARFYEHDNRDHAVKSLGNACETFKKFANSHDEAYSHITDEERDKVRDEASKVYKWLMDQTALQAEKGLDEDPAFTVQQINDRLRSLTAACKPIMTKPKPAPKPPTPVPAEVPPAKEEEKKEEGGAGEGDADVGGGGGGMKVEEIADEEGDGGAAVMDEGADLPADVEEVAEPAEEPVEEAIGDASGGDAEPAAPMDTTEADAKGE